MLKYRRCLLDGKCKCKKDDPMTGEKGKACFLTNGNCEHQGCQMIMPTNSKEVTGSLIIDAIEGRL